MKKILYIGVWVLLLQVNAFAAEESVFNEGNVYNTRLRKISLLLQGTMPANSDLENLAMIHDINEKENFIETKINEYLMSENYVAKMTNRLEELYRVRLTDPEGRAFEAFEDEYLQSTNSSLNILFSDLFSKNQPWDNLLTLTNYSLPLSYNVANEEMNAYQFLVYNHQFRDQARSEIENFLDSLTYEDEDGTASIPLISNNAMGVKNLAGSITTERFFSRYPTTKLNANRKRAAAIFRIFLCDSMEAVVLPSESDDKMLFDLSLNANQEPSHQDSVMTSMAKKHGEDPQCQSCHHKLDPMAKTFLGSSVVPNKEPSPGELVFYEQKKDGSKEKISIPVSGLNDLGHKITNQQQYLTCQVTHFWNWFVGENVPLSIEKKYELAEVFDGLERKPNDFIKFLLQSEDFIHPVNLQLDDLRYANLKTLFTRCDSCHTNEILAPVLSQGYPFSKDASVNINILNKIISSTDLHEQKSVDYMPPQNAGWTMSSFERNLLKAWITTGAKDNDGIEIEQELNTSGITYDENFITSSNFKFHDTSLRYLNNYDLLKVFKEIYNSGTCSELSNVNELITLGFKDPRDGKSLIESPNFLLLDWIKNCVEKSISINTGYSSFLPYPFEPKVAQNTEMKLDDILWGELDETEKQTIIQWNTDLLLGYKVLSAESYDSYVYRLLMALETSKDSSLKEAIKKIHVTILTSSEFLIY